MDLILWRHAEAHPQAPRQPDLERALTPKGERQARQMADWLSRHLDPAARVLVSPALRTQQTAQPLGRPFTTSAALAPGAGVADLLQAAGWSDAEGQVLVIGHQPTLGLVAARLLAGIDQPWAVRKASLWWLHGRDRNGFAQVTLQAVLSPELL